MEIGQLVKLDDNKEYVVLDKMILHTITYIILITTSKEKEMLVVTESNEDGKIILEEIKDNDEFDYVLSQYVLNPSN